MHRAACKIEFQPFKWSYSQLTFFNLKKKNTANTYDNGNAMFQGYLSKIFKKKKPAEDTLVPPLREHREKMFVFLGLFVHAAAVRGETCAFKLKIGNTLIKKRSRDDRPAIST